MSDLSPRTPPPPRSKVSRVLAPAAIVLGAGCVVVLIALMPAPKPEVVVTERPPVNVRVEVVTPISAVADSFEITGIVEPFQVVEIAAEVAGRVERMGERPTALAWRGKQFLAGTLLDEGQPVAQGDVVLHINRDLLQAREERAAAQFAFDEREYRRIQSLYETGTTSRQELDDARTRRDMSNAALEEARIELDRATVEAPISGVLNKLPLEIGEHAGVGDKVAEIVEIDRVKVVIQAPERDVGFLRLGQMVDIAPITAVDAPLAGEITYIDAVASESTRTTRVEITIDNRDGELRSGQIVRARVVRRMLDDVIMIPLASVIPLERGYEVYIVEDGKAARREITLGFIKGRDVRATSGLSGGEALIVEGHRFVSNGQAVQIIAADQVEQP